MRRIRRYWRVYLDRLLEKNVGGIERVVINQNALVDLFRF